jgi:hypothetical protein
MSAHNPQYLDGATPAGIPEAGARIVANQPLPSALTAFGLGVASGVVLALIVPCSTSRQDATLAQRISRQVLEGVTSIVPDAVAKHLP